MSPARRVRLLVAGTAQGVALLAAALDVGLLAERPPEEGPPEERLPEGDEERVLLVANTAAVPETTPAPDALPGFAPLRRRFDRVLSWNDVIRPLHPGHWVPRADDAPLWERQVRALWGLEDAEVELVVEDVHTAPAQALARIFPDAPLDVYATGAAAYGPTPGRLDPLLGTRVRRLLHPGLLPGLSPLLLAEFGVEPRAVPAGALRAVLAESARELPPPDAPGRCALLVGQDPDAPGALAAGEEERLQARMLRALRALGHRTVVFAPHPAAPEHRVRALRERAGRLGVELSAAEGSPPPEVLCERLRPALVTGFPPGTLLTASAVLELPAARCGTDAVLARMAPYENADRVPAVIAEALLPDLEEPAAGGGRGEETRTELAGLVRAMAFCMWPRVHPELRGEAERFLAAHPGDRVRRHFPRRRLALLALPGALPAGLEPVARSETVRRAARRARALGRRVRR
ncbi:alpha-2,8-polysialyltransferase family protein [Streptomyces glaucosporus]|uniref:Alpha-2,8-polysialyltransferase family protein n=1 Tax=Streptomyces glaucosporus TaxID=284044 RepID=A0ABN3I7G9_9ACTN